VGVTITILGILTLAFFVLTAVFFGKYNSMKSEFDRVQSDAEKFVKPGERNDAAVLAMAADAKKEGKSLTGYLRTRVGTMMKSMTGVEGTTFDDLARKQQDAVGSDSSPLLAIIVSKSDEITSLKGDVANAEKARNASAEELTRVKGQVGETQKALIDENGRLKKQIEGYEGEIQTYRAGLATAESKMTESIRGIEASSDERAKRDQGKISDLERENLVLVDQVAKLRGERRKELLSAQSEESLVDGTIIGLVPGRNEVAISLGSKQKVPLGLSFAVYGDSRQIKPNERTGEYARGKATLEVISVGEDTSICRITSETKGAPVVRGDVLANAVYDPSKVYKFVVFGNFDAGGDGISTPSERADMVALIEAWGGKAQDDLSGDVDFVVLGEKPVLPPKPGPDVPIEVVQQYVRVEREVARYDELFRSAQASGVPVLNQNRLFTLIGKTPAGRR
jgi:predicted  nucleic acid-binding Zn-ribbon protein